MNAAQKEEAWGRYISDMDSLVSPHLGPLKYEWCKVSNKVNTCEGGPNHVHEIVEQFNIWIKNHSCFQRQ